MKTAALVSGFRRFKGSTIVARGYEDALRQLGYEPRWYQCVDGKDPRQFVHGYRDVVGVTTGSPILDQGLNLAWFFPRRIGALSEDLVILTDQLLSPMLDRNPRGLVIAHDFRELRPETRTNSLSPMLARRTVRKLERARGILTDTDATRRDLQPRMSSPPPISVVEPCVRTSGDPPAHLRRSLARLREERRLQVLYVTVDRPYKNVKLFLDLARSWGAERKGVRTKFVLVSELRPSTQKELAREPIPALHVVPSVEDMTEIYESSDVLVFPSSFEGFGLPVAEAMGFGIPVVASSADAVVEVIGGSGICVPDRDVSAWVRALESLLDPSEYERWSLAAASRSKFFSLDSFQERLRKVLTQWG